jgi:hypothetical protein
LAQRSSRQKRKRRRQEAVRTGRQRPAAYARAEAKNQAVRDSLEPLAEGERPTAVTVGAVIALVLVIVQLPLYFIWDGDKRPSPVGFVFFMGLMLLMAWGMWKAKYWAVLGFQALLALTVLIFSLLLLQAANVIGVLIALVMIGAGGTLFWFMVKALARIQMPERR